MISVIVPVYNVEPYLSACIDSILAQTYQDFEVILVNDGSTDGSGEICDRYAKKDARIRIIHQENAGVSAARNSGLDAADGAYIAFVDSDDLIAETYFQVLYDNLTREQAEISTCGHLIFSGDSLSEQECKGDKIHALSGHDACIELYGHGKVITVEAHGKLYARSIWEKLRFPVGKIHEDQAVIPLALYAAKRVAATERKLYGYRVVESSIMHKPFSLKRYDDLEAVDACIAFFEQMKEYEIVEKAHTLRKRLLAVYTIYAINAGIYKQLPDLYKMTEREALQYLRKTTSDDKYTYYLAMIHPNWLRPHAYLRKIKKILHIPCN